MTSIFAEVLNMSGMASWLILAVIVVRILCRKTTKNLCYLLWAMVGIRLLCPFAIESSWSFIPNETSLQKVEMFQEQLWEDLDMEDTIGTNGTSGEIQNDSEKLLPQNGLELEQSNMKVWGMRPIELVTYAWAIGVIGILGYTSISYLRLKRKVAVSIHKTEELWVCDAIASPFVLGIFKPRVYIPSNVAEEQIAYILAHEKSHLKWHDNVWKLVGLVILAIHWFNPLVWLSYALLCRDIELACDERVVKKMDEQERRNYVKSLLLCSSPIHFAGFGSVAFGEISIRKRIKGVLNYKKASFWRVLVALVICGVVVVGFMTNPKGQEFIAEVESEVKEELKETRSKKKVIYETTADLNHDGIDDLVQVIQKAYCDEGYEQIDYCTNTFSVRIFLGEEEGKYSRNEVQLAPSKTIVWDIWVGQDMNGLYAITECEGKDYLLYAHTCELEGNARYRYDVIDVGQYNVANQVEMVNLTFACDPFYSQWDTEPHREEILPEFQEKITPWIENAKILLNSDETGIYVAKKNEEKPAKDYFETVWKRSDAAKVAEYETLEGIERWEKIAHRDSEEADKYIAWIKKLKTSDLSQWFEDYNGEVMQRINRHEDGSKHCSLSTCCDIIYRKDAFSQNTLIKMFWAMVDGKQEQGINCSYDIHAFGFSKQPVIQIAEDIWLVRYFNGYYGYEGVDGVTQEERIESTTNYYDFNNGLVALPRAGKSSEYWFILLEKDGVYRLERLENMMGG